MARTPRRRNRKKQGEGIGIHAPTIALVAVAATLLLSYLYLCGRCDDMGLRIRKLEQEKEALHRRVLNEEYLWSRTTSPGQIRHYLDKHGLQMGWPTEAFIVRIPLSTRLAFDDVTAPERDYAAREERTRHD